jgi:hypothetical protein
MPVDMDTITMMMEETEEYFSDVTEIADANLKHTEFKDYPRGLTGDYKRDYDVADKLYGKCLEAYDALRDAEEITKPRVARLQKAHDAFFTAIQVLEESNGMFQAFLDEGVAGKVAGIVALLSLLIKGQQKKFEALEYALLDIEKDLKAAKKLVTQAEIQRGVNTALSAIGLCLPALKGGRAVIAALASAGGKLTMDELLGPSGPDEAAAVKQASTEWMSMAEEAGKIGGKIAGVMSGVDTWVTDTKEVDKARKALKSIQKKLEAASKTHDMLERALEGSDKELLRLAIAFEKAVKAAHAAKGRFAEHEMTRYDLLADLAA